MACKCTPPQIQRYIARISGPLLDRILKVGRTIADLEGRENISEEHVSEAVNYRTLDRSFWQ